MDPPRVTLATVAKELDDDPADELWDPRGYVNEPPPNQLMQYFCRHCKCPHAKCHDKMFGKYIELQIVNQIFETGTEPTCHEVQHTFHSKYNRALEQKICEVTGTLDTSTYNVPHCVMSGSLDRLFQYIKARDYHFYMHSSITVGRGVPKKAQDKMFGSRKRK
jgi:hypothetical protein